MVLMAMQTIRLSRRVWDDFLDPAATDMQAALGLTNPHFRRWGKGWQVLYEDVPRETALELAEYLRDRGKTLLGQDFDDDDRERETLRAAVQSAERILALAQEYSAA